jgi:cytochrome b
MTPATSSPETQRPVWDLFVRTFHWTLVSCVLLNYFALEEGETPHQWVGYLASALVIARVLWGFIGSRHARFADFFPTPARLKQHLHAMRTRQPEHHWGHNPLGAMMMLLLMSLVTALGVTGWLQGTDAYFGEEWLQELHELLAHALVLSAGLHALAALVMGRIERTRLIKAMVTGVKERY